MLLLTRPITTNCKRSQKEAKSRKMDRSHLNGKTNNNNAIILETKKSWSSTLICLSGI